MQASKPATRKRVKRDFTEKKKTEEDQTIFFRPKFVKPRPSIAQVSRDAEHVIRKLARGNRRTVVAINVAPDEPNVGVEHIGAAEGAFPIIVAAGPVID